MPFNMKIYSKFFLALGFILLGVYSYYVSDRFTLKAGCCLGVGIVYLIYGFYTYKQAQKKGAR